MPDDIHLAQVENLVSILNQTPGLVRGAGRRALRGAGRRAASVVLKRARVLFKERIGRHSNALKRSLRLQEVRRGGGQFRVIYGHTLFANYAVFVELGHDVLVAGRKVGEAKPNKVLLDALDDTKQLAAHVYVQDLARRVGIELRRAGKGNFSTSDLLG